MPLSHGSDCSPAVCNRLPRWRFVFRANRHRSGPEVMQMEFAYSLAACFRGRSAGGRVVAESWPPGTSEEAVAEPGDSRH